MGGIAVNSDQITQRLRDALESAGLTITSERHPASLTVEFSTCPPLTWSFADCDQATAAIFDTEIGGKTIGDHFSTDHDRTHSYWRFRLETYDLDPELTPHAGRTLFVEGGAA
jgi:hypothetical protein